MIGRVKITGNRGRTSGGRLRGEHVKVELLDAQGKATTIPTTELTITCDGKKDYLWAHLRVPVHELDVETLGDLLLVQPDTGDAIKVTPEFAEVTRHILATGTMPTDAEDEAAIDHMAKKSARASTEHNQRMSHRQLDDWARERVCTRRIYEGADPPPAAPPVEGAVWDKFEGHWCESDESLRRRVKEAADGVQ